MWSRIGFFAITLLPVVGLYTISQVSRKNHFLKLGYVLAILYLIYFIFVPKSIAGAICGGNYIIFDAPQMIYRLYGFYYFGFLILGIWSALEGIILEERPTREKSILEWFIAGYASFMVPMALVYIVFPVTRQAITSIMCGFAIIFAFILAFKITPKYHAIHKEKSKKAIKK